MICTTNIQFCTFLGGLGLCQALWSTDQMNPKRGNDVPKISYSKLENVEL